MTFREYQEAARLTARYPADVNYPVMGLAGETGEVCEHFKKAARDDGGKLTDERRGKVAAELGDVLWYVAAIASDLGLSMEQVAVMNLAKVGGRLARGTISGSGDDR